MNLTGSPLQGLLSLLRLGMLTFLDARSGWRLTAKILLKKILTASARIRESRLGAPTVTRQSRVAVAKCLCPFSSSYDFNSQDLVAAPEDFKIYPSDKFRTNCIYDSTGRTQVTKGGDATDDEMCIGFLVYYPEKPTAVAQGKDRFAPDFPSVC